MASSAGGRTLSTQAAGTGILVALVGYASSVAVVIQGLTAVGASPAQVVSALLAVGLAMGVPAMLLSRWSRMPVSVAWTTPGMALLAGGTAVEGGFAAAVGAFLITGGLIMLAGLWAPLGRWVAAIPKPIANAMLAGILLKLCLAPFVAVGEAPVVALLVLVTWIIVGRFARLYAVPAAVAVALAAMVAQAPAGPEAATAFQWPELVPVAPVFTAEGLVGLALPLFVVTMASQNIPGLAVLHTFGFRPKVPPLFLLTGAASALSAPFGAPTVNLAAITAALCASPDAEADPARRWQAAFVGGIGYIALGALAAVTAALVLRSPPILIEAVAGLALVNAFGGAVQGAVAEEEYRLPALMTLLTTASGLVLGGIGSAFWGLVIGGALALLHRKAEPTTNNATAARKMRT